MATRVKQVTATQESEAEIELDVLARPEWQEDDPLTVLRQIVFATWADPRLGVVCLHGERQAGKTTLCGMLAAEQARWQAICNVQVYPPEDIIGYPFRAKGVLKMTNPPFIPAELWFGDKAGLITWDEVSWSREENQAVLLPALAERRLGMTKLRDNIAQIACMNPPKRVLIDPLLARFIFIGFPLEGMDIVAHMGMTTVKRAFKRVWTADPQNQAFPGRFATPGAGKKLDLWCAKPEFWASPLMQRWIVRGLFPKEAAESILYDLTKERPKLDPVEWLRRVPAAELATGLVESGRRAASSDETGKMMQAWATVGEERLQADKTGEWQRVFTAFSQCREALRGAGKGATNEEVEAGRAALLKMLEEGEGK